MPFGIDIQEDEILSWGHEILENLLADHTTGENIIWATDDYSARGDGYQSLDAIGVAAIIITSSNHVYASRLRNRRSALMRKQRSLPLPGFVIRRTTSSTRLGFKPTRMCSTMRYTKKAYTDGK